MPNDIHTYIKELNIPIDDTLRMDCPVCNGYNTFTVTNSMGLLLYNCYKASCNVSGKSKIRITMEDIQKKMHKKEAEELLPNLGTELPEYIVGHENRPEIKTFADTYEISLDKLDLQYDVKEHRVVFPIYQDGVMVDGTGRSLGKKLPKWKRYGNTGLPFTFGCGKVAVVVEDCISASVIGGDVYVGVAVLGTSLSDLHKKYLSQFSTTIIALDPDAIPKTISFAKELRQHVADVKVLKLKDDLKYLNTEDIMNLYSLTPKEKLKWR